MSSLTPQDQIQQLYIGYYGRPGDAAGISFWSTQLTNAGGNLSSIVNAFAASPESVALYGSGDNASTLVTAIYENVLHRTPDAGGEAFYTNALTTGQISAGNLAVAVLNGVQNGDVATVNNELTDANQFTAHLTSYGGDAAAAVGRTFLQQASGDSTANAALLNQVTAYTNAAAAATTDPSLFSSHISNGVLTNPSIVNEYANGTTPVVMGTPSAADSNITVAQAEALPAGTAFSLSDTPNDFFTTTTGTLAPGVAALLAQDPNVTVVYGPDIGPGKPTPIVPPSIDLAQAEALQSATTGTLALPCGLADSAANLFVKGSDALAPGVAALVSAYSSHFFVGTGTVTVAQVEALEAVMSSPLVSNDYNVADTLANLKNAPAGMVQTPSYNALNSSLATNYTVVDSSTNIFTDAGDTNHLLANAADIVINVDRLDDAGTINTTNALGTHLTITGSANLTLTLSDNASPIPGEPAQFSAPLGSIVDASSFTGTLTFTDSGIGDTILTGSGSSTSIETGSNADGITFGSRASGVVDTLVLSTAPNDAALNIAARDYGFPDEVTGFVLGQDVIQLKSVSSMAIGTELGANANGMVSNTAYANSGAFLNAAEAITNGKAGEAITWVDTANHNTYLVVYEGAGANEARIVELMGVSATTGVSLAGSGIHIV